MMVAAKDAGCQDLRRTASAARFICSVPNTAAERRFAYDGDYRPQVLYIAPTVIFLRLHLISCYQAQ